MQKQVLLFKGSFIESKRLEIELIANKINPIIINKKQSAILSGFGYNPNDDIFIYVFEDQLKSSKLILSSLTI
ncbi:hypothetical protein N9C11_03920 [Flavobacteriaceae bacterium]|jgi:hypothetical protein|nr:hypothetical protein [Flavobacteriaceae bacterium]MBT4231761.1 hypothetical protein [Flavobacteriaceae bacterium]MBT5393274.1 hypothetical protein [Flavobacteriaceae bacterium]MBT7574971.1 hypothetical protein [Flavobacteriaceae bacterium]MBT7984697.1 hypothetical protein [Flavobacteriaceae bacterium]